MGGWVLPEGANQTAVDNRVCGDETVEQELACGGWVGGWVIGR